MGREERELGNSPEIGSTEKRFLFPYDKITSRAEALRAINVWRSKGLRVVFADAVLDIPHYRHADYFLACANFGEKLVVRLATDELIKRKKNPEGPVVPWRERAMHAAHYPYIDLVMPKTRNGWKWAQDFRPDVIVNSNTSPLFVIKDLLKNRDWLRDLGVRLVALDELAQEIPFSSLYEQCLLYNRDKYNLDKFSGTRIKEIIVERARGYT